MGPDQLSIRNLLLRRLAPEDYAVLQPALRRIAVERGTVLLCGGDVIERAHFLEDGVCSLVIAGSAGERTEIALVGREGMTASSILLGATRSATEAFMQVGGGTAIEVSADALLDAAAARPDLRTRLLRYANNLGVQITFNVVANARLSLEQRLARWLLMCHDRRDGDEISITHEFLGQMLAVRRSGVTVALHTLEGAGLVRARRGSIYILDRAALEAMSNGAYGAAEAEYRTLLGSFGKGPAAMPAGAAAPPRPVPDGAAAAA